MERQVSVITNYLNRSFANLNGSAPADNKSDVVFPTQAAWVHVWPQTDIVPQDVCDALFSADIIDFNSLKEVKLYHLINKKMYFLVGCVRLITHHIVGPGNEVSSPLYISDCSLTLMKN